MGDNDRGRILCVEDHADTCDMVQTVLPEFEIVAAATAADAIEKASQGGFVMILMDYHLLDGTGEDACYAIRRFDQRTPILFITSSAAMSSTKAVAMGAQGVLRKEKYDFVEMLCQLVAELALT